MDMPVELQSKLTNLTPYELDELEAWFAHLPVYDEEIRTLIASNVDALVRELNGSWISDTHS
ncbi:MAG TPA: hypothetical protein V6D20_01455 [Candidatus Obscuribacterales bacterium]|uniref:hypothetical protein n=1 Tax=Leptolyngbya sp. CCY15150 TaxID=2767772 RepID=UPI00194F4559|nr:hypothetical protein [Leptolyngbya sp. CCY15150]